MFKLFGNTTIDSYCLKLPQGIFSLSKFYPTDSDPLLQVLRENYSKYVLSLMLVSPTFWSVDALTDYYENGLIHNIPWMQDVGFEKLEDGSLIITLKTLGIDFSIPKSMKTESIRFTPGLFYNGGDKKWISLGFEGIYSDKKTWKIYGIGVELKNSNASSVLNRVREEEEEKKILKHTLGKNNIHKESNGSKIWRKEIKSKKNGIDMTLFAYNAPFKRHSESNTLMKINFYSIEPFEVAYQLLKDK